MKNYLLILITFITLTTTGLLAQNRPPAEVDKAVRATVDLLMNSSATDYKEFISKYYSSMYNNTATIDSLVNHIKEIKKSTQGAGGIDVSMEDGKFQIGFSGGVDAIVELIFEKDQPAKIRSLNLAEAKDPSDMTDEELFMDALEDRMMKLESLPKINNDSEFEVFIKQNFSPSFLANSSKDELIISLKKLRVAVAGASMFSAKPSADGKGAILELRGGKSADAIFSIEEKAPYLISQFKVDDTVTFVEGSAAELFPLTWGNYQNQLNKEEAKGFSGVVLIVQNGKIQHQKGYGFANKEDGIKNNDQTIFDIGSIPIDFTRAAILKLVDEKKVSYSDPISKFIKNVPKDKMSITIEHLMTNKSGLHNFHGDDSDNDLDLSWISREEAINRMLGRSLLFAAGTDVSPSHSGYGLLAAIVEIVSGKTYESFLTENFFNPLKMKNTGPYGMQSGLSPEHMAVGYGNQASEPNIPTNWGPTSWLIKGSGGMVSNPMDLYLWNKGLHSGKILSQKSKEIYQQGTMALGGSDRGFFASYLRSPDNTVIICSNSDRSVYPDAMKLFQSLNGLYK